MPTFDRLAAALSGRYRFERELGQGGMATVYRAADLKHDRRVAIKVLKPELAAVLGAERFVVEIKTTAALSHPHILPLFDSGEADGFLYYVMPYIEGETIRERLNRETQLSVDEAVRITREIADALDYAHRHGVIHRDIKPENLLLHDGRPMVMDFGIALALSAAAGGRMTETGLSLGTPHYMSPEQATAEKDITARSDVYSLASVLYEMLTGQPPHDGGSAQQVIMRIITDTPRLVTELRKSVPRHVADAVAKALEKLPADRFASAREFAEALANPAFTTAAAGAPAAGTVSLRVLGRELSWRAILATGVLGGALLASSGWMFARGAARATTPVVLRAELELLTRADSNVLTNGLDISPDGSMIVYAARQPNSPVSESRLYLRRLDDRTARLIPGTEGATQPTFSPDGAWIAFVQTRAIRRLPVGGVVVENVVQGDAQAFYSNLRWATDGFIYYDGDAGLARVHALGTGAPISLLTNSVGSLLLGDPLPGGRHVLYTECCDDQQEVRVLDIKTGDSKALGLRARIGRYAPTGHLILIANDAVKAVPFDAKSLAVRGEPRAILDSVTANGSVRSFAVAASGTAVYIVGASVGNVRRVGAAFVDLAGAEQRLPLAEGVGPRFWFSRDGRQLAHATGGVTGATNDDSKLSVYDVVVGTTVQIAPRPGFVSGLIWLPGDRELIFGAGSREHSYIARARLDRPGRLDTLWRDVQAREIRSPLSVTADGRRLLMQQLRGTNNNLVLSPLDSALGEPTDYLVANWNESAGRLSPDGQWVVYTSNEEAPASFSFQPRVYVRSFPEPGERYAVSDSAGSRPLWAPDGKSIYYLRGTTVVAASVTTSPTFRVTARRDLFTWPTFPTGYDISPDGKRFVIPAPPAAVSSVSQRVQPTRLVVVGNWVEELRRKLVEQ